MSKRNRALRYKKLSLGKVVLKFRENRPMPPNFRRIIIMAGIMKTDRHIGMITVYWHGQKKFMIHRQMHGIGLKPMEQWQGIRMSLLY